MGAGVCASTFGGTADGGIWNGIRVGAAAGGAAGGTGGPLEAGTRGNAGPPVPIGKGLFWSGCAAGCGMHQVSTIGLQGCRSRLSDGTIVDAAHVYVGLVGGVFILAKVSRVRFHYKVSGVPEVIPWQRWISWSLLILYSSVFVSGVLALLPLHGRLYEDVLNFHLLSSVWAIPPTTWPSTTIGLMTAPQSCSTV